ncbi:MAG: hypothetical protein AAF687_02275 [Pseudomonadota bacterium]
MNLPIMAIALAGAGLSGAADVQATNSDASMATSQQSATVSFTAAQSSAIARLEAQLKDAPEDPALLINLGIVHAQAGSTDKAKAYFKAALDCDDPIELETADGRVRDPRKLARTALAMLERGEFQARPDQITQRD